PPLQPRVAPLDLEVAVDGRETLAIRAEGRPPDDAPAMGQGPAELAAGRDVPKSGLARPTAGRKAAAVGAEGGVLHARMSERRTHGWARRPVPDPQRAILRTVRHQDGAVGPEDVRDLRAGFMPHRRAERPEGPGVPEPGGGIEVMRARCDRQAIGTERDV